MNIKGKSTISLYDAATGRQVEEYVNENKVTNAFNNMLSFRESAVMTGVDLNAYLTRLTPFYPNFLRGILLWDSTIPDNDLNRVFPPAGVRCVGHAGISYSGNTLTRGTFNANESSEAERSVKMVWDFATDRANGTIRSCSLTSITGGNTGWMIPLPASGADNDARFYQFIGGPSASLQISYSSSSLLTNSTICDYVGELREGVHTYIYPDAHNLMVVEQRYTKHNEIDMFTLTGSNNNANATETVTAIPWGSAPPAIATIRQSWILDENNLLVMTEVTNLTNVRVRWVNLITKQIVRETTFTLSQSVYAPYAFFKNHLYSVVSNNIRKYNTEGALVDTMMTTGNIHLHAYRFSCLPGGDYLTAGANNDVSASPYIVMTDGTNYAGVRTNNSGNALSCVISPSASFKAPAYISVINSHTNSSIKSLALVAPFMATINNLSSPVVKTNANTMKITYELTQE